MKRAVRTMLQWLKFRWGIVTTLTIGVAVAVGLATLGPLLIDHVLTYALRRSLLNNDPAVRNIRLTLRLEAEQPAFDEVDRWLQSTAATELSDTPYQWVPIGTLPTALPWQDGRLLSDQRIDIQFYGAGLSALDERVTFEAGDWPAATQLPDGVIPAVIGRPMADTFALAVGDRLPLSNRISGVEPNLWLEISGIIQPRDNQDAFWFGEQNPLRPRDDNRHIRHSAFVDQSHFFALAQRDFPGQDLTFNWLLLIDPHQLTRDHLDTLPPQLAALENQLVTQPDPLRVTTRLPRLLADYQAQANELATPLTFITFTTMLLAFVFVVMAARLAAEQQQGEWALMRSRGLPHRHLLLRQAGRTAAICVIGLGLGWVVAAAFERGLNLVGPLAQIRDPNWHLPWPPTAWLTGAITAALSFVLLLGPFIRINHRQPSADSRPAPPWWQQLYVDGLLLAVGLLLLLRFWLGGGLIAADPNQGVDWLLVVAPLLTIIGLTLMLLRLLPLLLHQLAQTVGRTTPLAPFLAVAYTARSQRQAIRLMLLFALTVAIGIFGSTVDAALAHNETARARYATGGELQLVGIDPAAVGQIDRATAVWRGEGSFAALISSELPTYDILAVEPASLRTIANVPDHFADVPLSLLLDQLPDGESLAAGGLSLPADTAKIGLWLQVPRDEPEVWQGIDLAAKLSTPDGRQQHLTLTDTGRSEAGWRYYEAVLPQGEQQVTRLRSIWLRSRLPALEFRRNIAFDDFTLVNAAGEVTVLDDFEDGVGRWATYEFSHGVVAGDVDPHNGRGKMELRFWQATIHPDVWYGIMPFSEGDAGLFLIPAIVSRQFADLTAVQPGDIVEMRIRLSPTDFLNVNMQVLGITNYFPTLYDDVNHGYIIISRAQILALLNNTRYAIVEPTELLVGDTAVDATIASEATRVISAAAVAQTLQAYPLAVGLRTASQLGYLLATAISLGGFAAHIFFVMRRRRSQFAILRALGVNANQLYLILALEQTVLIFIGLLLGSGFGLVLSWLALHNLNFDWGGLAAAPPFEVVWDWSAIGRIYLYFGLTLSSGLAVVVWLSRRAGLQRALRLMAET